LLAANRCEAVCTISTTGVSFGSYDVYSATALDSTGSVTYNCGVGTLVISVDLSKGASASFNPRTLQSGPQPLNYNLYTNAARTSIWGDATAGTSNYSATLPPLNTNVTVTVYGRVPPLQDAAAGSYADTVVVTVNF
jgi:spore coat protein U domain-containing protein, fimbrial subunit CupE1/2/3/6